AVFRYQAMDMAGRRQRGRAEAALLTAGLPLARALDTAAGVVGGDVGASLRSVRADIERGDDLATALARHGRTFPPVYVGLVRAGERSGDLDGAFRRLADQLEREDQLRSRIASAMIYPLLLAVVGGVAVVVLLLFVLPRFVELLEGAGAAVPRSTAAVRAAIDGRPRRGVARAPGGRAVPADRIRGPRVGRRRVSPHGARTSRRRRHRAATPADPLDPPRRPRRPFRAPRLGPPPRRRANAGGARPRRGEPGRPDRTRRGPEHPRPRPRRRVAGPRRPRGAPVPAAARPARGGGRGGRPGRGVPRPRRRPVRG